MKNGQQLLLNHCPHCEVTNPLLTKSWAVNTASFDGSNGRLWTTYTCATCGGVILTACPSVQGSQPNVTSVWPPARTVADELPSRAREYLRQAVASRHAPSGAIVLAASAVDAMMKDKGYKDGSLFTRIDLAATAHLITDEMAAWAHEIRLDANDQRHADENAPLPDSTEADKAIEFAEALGQFLYVLPAMVKRGRKPPASATPTSVPVGAAAPAIKVPGT
jgi:hypothetical protein